MEMSPALFPVIIYDMTVKSIKIRILPIRKYLYVPSLFNVRP